MLLGVSLVAHHLLGPGYLPRLGFKPVKVDICLETYLPVAEEDIVLSLAIILVTPFAAVGLCGSLPFVMLRPAY